MDKLCYTIPECQRKGAGSRTKIYEALNAGSLKARKRGKRTIILAVDLQRYLESLPNYEPKTPA